MKRLLKKLCTILVILILCLLGLIACNRLHDNYLINYRYSIPMPTILGQFEVSNDYIQIWGLENIVGDQIASLSYNEISCVLSRKYCMENRFAIANLGSQISIFPYHKEYRIKYIDKNKIIFNGDNDTSGEIDLNDKTLVFTVKNAGINSNETRKVEVITDNNKIQELEKKIIRKYLKTKLF